MNIKIKINSDLHSKEIQTLLFDMGCCWGQLKSDKNQQNIHARYLFVDKYKMITYMNGDLQGKKCWRDSYKKEIKMAHPSQIEFLKSLTLRDGLELIQNIISTGFYHVKNKDYLNELLIRYK